MNRAAAHDAMRGLALGDAFGETWFRAPAPTREVALAQRRLAEPPWRWTDDTAMALSVLKVLHERGGVDADALAAEFAASYLADPDRDYGRSMHLVLRAIADGEPWEAATRRQFGGQGSWGNGAAMRVAPLGAWFRADPAVAAEHAARSAVVTHAHPEAVAGAVAVATATALNACGQSIMDGIEAWVPEGQVAAGLRRAAAIPAGTDPREAAAVLGCGQRLSAPDTVPYAVWCAARHADDLPEALWATVSAGGDSDTTCAIVGGIVAARTGLAGVPAQWLAACEPLPGWIRTLER